MISTTERRQGENARIPCAIPVELSQDAGRPGFEAAAVDLSAGGLSLRASKLPEVGATLHCQFETLPGGTRISGRGEVVWAKLSGERSGEFGLRFTDIEPEAQALIAEMIAERVAMAGNNAPREPRMATLEFEHVEAPITAKLTRAAGRDVVFEQPLGVLALGSGVIAHSDKSLGHGNLLRVDLRMDGGTPMLALTVRFSEPQEEYGEYDWGEPESGTLPKSADPELLAPELEAPAEVDTIPDLAAPLGVFEDPTPQPMAAGTGDDEDTERDALPKVPVAVRHTLPPAPPRAAMAARSVPTPVSQPGLVRAQTPHDYATPHDYELQQDEPSVQEYDAIAIDGVEHESAPGTYHEPLQLSAARAEQKLSLDDEDTWSVSDSARKSALVRFLRIFAAIKNALAGALALAMRGRDKASRVLAPYLNRRPLRRTALTSTLRGVGMGSGSAGVSATRVRRSTGGGPAAMPLPKWTHGIGRFALLALLMFTAGVVLVYSLKQSTAAEEIELHRTVTAEPIEPETTVNAAIDPESELAAPSGTEPTAPLPRPQAAKAAKTSLVSAPVSSLAPAGASTFGHKHVPNAQRFLLRMNGPVAGLQGKGTQDGFSVLITGARAIDRAAPIAQASKSVARARILNRGANSELTILFEDGKSPAYRVIAQPAGLEVLISP